MDNIKQARLLEIFFRSLRGENLSAKDLANEYGVSARSITRDLTDLTKVCSVSGANSCGRANCGI